MLRCFAVVLALVWAVRDCAGPDDDFITIYNLIQVTDSRNLPAASPVGSQMPAGG